MTTTPAATAAAFHTLGTSRVVETGSGGNPYVSGSHVSPPEGRPYADRSRNARGMIHDGDEVEQAFAKKAGWEWLGDGPQSIRDYQHFSSTGN